MLTKIIPSDGAAAGYGFKRIQAHKSGPHDFEKVQFGQDLSGYHEGAIWCMKFSLNGGLVKDFVFVNSFLIRLAAGNSGARSLSSDLGFARQVHILPRYEAEIPARA